LISVLVNVRVILKIFNLDPLIRLSWLGSLDLDLLLLDNRKCLSCSYLGNLCSFSLKKLWFICSTSLALTFSLPVFIMSVNYQILGKTALNNTKSWKVWLVNLLWLLCSCTVLLFFIPKLYSLLSLLMSSSFESIYTYKLLFLSNFFDFVVESIASLNVNAHPLHTAWLLTVPILWKYRG